MASSLLVFDVKEKETASSQAPSFPQAKSSPSGFPEHKKRTRISAFKQQRKTAEEKRSDVPASIAENIASPHIDGQHAEPSGAIVSKPVMTEKQRIDQENNERIANMSSTEIEEARSELFNGLDSKMLEMLLKRANLDEKNSPSPFDDEKPAPAPEIKFEGTSEVKPDNSKVSNSKGTPRKVHFEDAPDEDDRFSVAPAEALTSESSTQPEMAMATGDSQPPSIPHDHDHGHNHKDDFVSSKPHWPQPPVKPDLDPSDPDFLSSLHEKYFPQLPADPTKLAWMAPIPTTDSPADFDSPYHPNQSSIPVSQLRFDFKGALLPPRIARAVPTTRGLHHHGEAPEAAGYTIKELAGLARSAVAGQRCISYQTLGRILYRLGHGNYGLRGDDLSDGIWNSMLEGKVLESLYEEAGVYSDAPAVGGDVDDVGASGGRGRGHRSAHAFAVEAIWLFEKGGWGEKVRRAN